MTAHEPVLSHRNSAFTLLAETEAIRVMEGGSGYAMGMMPVAGHGCRGTGFQARQVQFRDSS